MVFFLEVRIDTIRIRIERISMEQNARIFGHIGEDWYNSQPSYAQLMRDGHYLGFWSDETPIPDLVIQRIQKAWLFLRDFPKYQFEDLSRMENRWNFERFPFAAYARDTIVPKYHKIN